VREREREKEREAERNRETETVRKRERRDAGREGGYKNNQRVGKNVCVYVRGGECVCLCGGCMREKKGEGKGARKKWVKVSGEREKEK